MTSCNKVEVRISILASRASILEFPFQVSATFDLSKNEATDLYENKGSALEKIRNEATVGKPSAFVYQFQCRERLLFDCPKIPGRETED